METYSLLPRGEATRAVKVQRGKFWQWLGYCSLAVIITYSVWAIKAPANEDFHVEYDPSQPACPQFPALQSFSDDQAYIEKEIQDEFATAKFFEKSLKKLQGAIQIPTESYDGMGEVGEDPRWEIFNDFHVYLEDSFPLVFKKLSIKKPNTHGLLIEWKGSDPSLKPYVFMAHQDVVPVPAVTEYRWKYPPYSAHYDGRFIWGRGAADCKNNLIGILEALETLLEKHYEPKRTIISGFGFDEEISGFHGAAYISKYLVETLGRDSIELIIDEGGLGIKEMYGAMFALPGVAEKGYHDIKITVETEGGHSSVPPDHTGIGILSRIVAAIEDSPYKPSLTPANPYFTTLQCAAEYGGSMPSRLQTLIKKSLTSKSAAKSLAEYLAKDDIRNRYLMQTSQASDIISGGVKINALPEKVYAVVNHRIAVESHTGEVRENMQSVLEDAILSKFALSLDAWGSVSGNTSSTSVGQIILSDFEEPLEPSPVSPYDTDAYKLFTGTIKQVLGRDIIVAPSIMTGNTDTKYYWNLSKNIYRFSPCRDEGKANGHTVDERIGMIEHIEGVKFYAQIVMNSGHL
ncbi:peptidase family M20/M25/M40 [Phlyctema vagabunda]|uniref:Peptidase family M20/M25/M40 n=1 Tax=Phlyctema vagabunda TaxID=108571 RepID=A0ABR4P1P7_9HELO